MRHRLKVCAPARSAQPFVEDMTSAVIHRKWSTSEVVRSAHEGAVVFTKTYTEGAAPGMTADVIRARTAREMGLHERIARSGLFVGRLGIVPLVEGNPQVGRIVTQGVEGAELGQFIQRSRSRAEQRSCLRALWLAGQWQRQFQKLAIVDGDDELFVPDPIDVADYCDLRQQRALDLGYGWPSDELRRRTRLMLQNLVERSSEAERGFVWCHGDYGAQNMLWDGRVLTPLDFAMARLDYPLVDVTHLIHRLEMLAIYFPWKRWPIAAWRQAVLRGYQQPDAASTPMYQALMIRHLHCRLVTYVRRKPLSLKERLHNIYVRNCVRRKLERLISAGGAV